MRNRHLFLFLTVLLAASLAAGCSRPLTKGETDQFEAIAAKIAKAEKMDAKTCAPKELAIAKAELDGARHEATESREVAHGYIAKADKAADTLLAKTIPCWEARQPKAEPPKAEPPPLTLVLNCFNSSTTAGIVTKMNEASMMRLISAW